MSVRLDQLLVEKGLTPDLDRARRLIAAGLVLVEDRKMDKAGTKIKATASIRLIDKNKPYASRGGLKLEGPLETFGIDVKDKIAADLGASTGGFTDCLLQRGARLVHAVDVGYGILDWSLRQDPRVHVHERTNARHLTPDMLNGPVDFCVADLSFISLVAILPAIKAILMPDACALLMVKPQFELPAAEVPEGGVVTDDALRQKAVDLVVQAACSIGFILLGQTDASLAGPKGNREIFIYLQSSNNP